MNYKKQTVLFRILLVAIVVGSVSWFGSIGSFQTAPAISDAPQVASRYHTRNRATRSFNRDAEPTQGKANRPTTERDVDQPASPRDVKEPAVQRNVATTEGRDLGTQLASRYHSRNRATQTFKRVAVTTADRYLADRYHGRNRTTQFFGLPAGPTSTGQKAHNLQREAEPTHDLDTQLASRYHLRTRTERFFERATSLA